MDVCFTLHFSLSLWPTLRWSRPSTEWTFLFFVGLMSPVLCGYILRELLELAVKISVYSYSDLDPRSGEVDFKSIIIISFNYGGKHVVLFVMDHKMN